jgi:hypothetical protein
VSDLQILEELLEGHDEELTLWEREAFASMHKRLEEIANMKCAVKLTPVLTEKQRLAVDSARARLGLIVETSKNLYSRGLVPDGKHVPTPDVLKALPKKPPGRRP